MADKEIYEKVEEVSSLFLDGNISLDELKSKLQLHLNECTEPKDFYLFGDALINTFDPDIESEDEDEDDD